MSSRRARRRRERERARRPSASRGLPPLQRLLLTGAGLVMIFGGVALLAASASAGSAERLGRVAGILIVIGLVVLAIGMIGRV